MNCWPGCIARVIADGTWVLCIELDSHPSYTGPVWKVEMLSAGRVHATQYKGSPQKTRPPGHVCHCRDSALRPIPPDELHDSTLTEEPLHASA